MVIKAHAYRELELFPQYFGSSQSLRLSLSSSSPVDVFVEVDTEEVEMDKDIPHLSTKRLFEGVLKEFCILNMPYVNDYPCPSQ